MTERTLPPFDQHGNLPPGVHRVVWDEFVKRFGQSSVRRQVLTSRLREIVGVARESGFLARVFVWGSMVTERPFPRDLDLLLLMRAGFDKALPHCSAHVRELFQHPTARLRYEADIFWVAESVGETALAEFLSVYQRDRDFRLRGIVEVAFDDPES